MPPSPAGGTVTGRTGLRRLIGVQDKEILRLAVPAFFALVSEPLMLLADSAIVGHLGTPQLAALGVAGTILQTLVGVCVFLAYGTTSSVARRIGAGDHRGALAQGIDGLWLALLLGVLVSCKPRSTPVAASRSSIDGIPKQEIRR